MQKRISTLALAFLMLASTVSCGGGSTVTESTTAAPVETTALETEYVYEYPKTFDGYEFTILNAGDIYNMRAEIDREELTGDSLDDAMFNRCRLVEQKLDITLTEVTGHVDGGLADQAQQSILAGEDEYDIMYIPARDLYKFTSEGYLNNLLEFDELKLDEEWWSQSYNDSCIINDSLYAAIGASQLMYIDSLWALFFNEDMMTDLGLEMPYDLVREYKWTIDRYDEYIKAGAQLNGDDSFAWNENGNCIYGMSGGASDKFLAASGEFFVESQNGKLALTAGSAAFYDIADRLSKLLNTEIRFVSISGVADGNPGNYITTFETGRALFGTAELSKTSRMRDKNFSFGIVPFPKYDEAQEVYYSVPFYATPGLTIPVTVKDPERSAIVSDALAYHGNEMVLPIFREVTLEQKGLRNDDSIEMLDIIIKSSHADLCYIFNAASTMRTNVGNAIAVGDPIASIIASEESAAKETIAKVNGETK